MLALSQLRREIEGNYPASVPNDERAQAAVRRVLASKRVVGASPPVGSVLGVAADPERLARPLGVLDTPASPLLGHVEQGPRRVVIKPVAVQFDDASLKIR